MRIHAMKERSSVNGPGERAVVWFQGCDLKCPGCWNPDTHRHGAGQGRFYTPFGLGDALAELTGIEGVTFSGGEPLQQLEDGLDLAVGYLKARRPDLSVGIYTGYSRSELEAGKFRSSADPAWKAPLYKKAEAWAWFSSQIDFAVMGRYNQLKPVDQPLVTSGNQELVLFSDRYKPQDFPPQQVEYEISPEGLVTITGFPVESRV